MQALLPVFRSILLWTLACIVCIHAFGEPEKTAKSSAGKPRGTAVVMSACFFPEKHWNVSLMSYVHLESIEKPEKKIFWHSKL